MVVAVSINKLVSLSIQHGSKSIQLTWFNHDNRSTYTPSFSRQAYILCQHPLIMFSEHLGMTNAFLADISSDGLLLMPQLISIAQCPC